MYPVFPGIPRIVDLFPAGGPWREATMLWVASPSYAGPVLVRGGQVDGPARLGFGPGDLPERELRLPPGEWATGGELRVWEQTAAPPEGWRVAAASLRIRARGCYAFQVDGETFSETIAFFALPQPEGRR